MKSIRIIPIILLGLSLTGLAATASASGERVDQTLDMSAEGRVDVNVVRGEVRFRGWDKSEVRVVGVLDEETESFTFDGDGNDARIRVKIKERKMSWFSDTESSDLTIYVPVEGQIDFSGVSTDVDVTDFEGSVEIGVVSGDLYLEGGRSRITIQTVSGDVELRESEGRVRIKTVSGDVESYNTTGDAQYTSVSGNLVIHDGGVDLRAESVSGDIEVDNNAMNVVGGHSVSGDIDIAGDPGSGGSVEFDSVSGSIRVRLGGDISARFDIETGSGSIRNRLTDDKPRVSKYQGDETLRFTVGDGDGEVILTTRSGDISIGRR